jgi:hypothetical protein
LIEPRREAPRTFVASFATAFTGEAEPALFLHFADDLVDASLDGRPLALEVSYDGTLARARALGSGEHTLRFRTTREFPGKSCVWLKGPFTLQSLAPYSPGPNATIRTAGPFAASAHKPSAAAELITAGFPFLHQPLIAETTVSLAAVTRALCFTGVSGDAVRVSIDGQSAGWAWGPDWQLTLATPLAAGAHRLSLELVPSTFNHFGPHHYYNGDWHVVSPGQVLGEKNFADLPDAPNATHVPEWHFKPLRLPTSVSAAP